MALKLRNLGQRGRNRLAKAGEGDRVIQTKMVGLFSMKEVRLADIPQAQTPFRRETESRENKSAITLLTLRASCTYVDTART